MEVNDLREAIERFNWWHGDQTAHGTNLLALDAVVAFVTAPLPSCIICGKPFTRTTDNPLIHNYHNRVRA